MTEEQNRRTFHVTINDSVLEVALEQQNEQTFAIIENRKYEVGWLLRSSREALLQLNSAVYNLLVHGDRETITLNLNGYLFVARVEDARLAFLKNIGGAPANSRLQHELRAPMPGLVLKVLVKAGDEVAAGEGLMVIEAMKMENELKAGRAGKIAEILVKEGQAVEKGALLMRFAGEPRTNEDG